MIEKSYIVIGRRENDNRLMIMPGNQEFHEFDSRSSQYKDAIKWLQDGNKLSEVYLCKYVKKIRPKKVMSEIIDFEEEDIEDGNV